MVGLDDSEFERHSTVVERRSEGSSLGVSRVSDEKLFDRWVFKGDDAGINVT